MFWKFCNIITLGQCYSLATILYFGIGLILYGITPSQTPSYLYAEYSGCGGELICADGETCCDGSCCSGVCCNGNCLPAGTVCCDSNDACPSGQKCCHGNCIPENSECCEDGTAGDCGCCKPAPTAKTTAINCAE
ncbi:MAG: hypothetical protein LBE18_09405 [Planctomycetaceae bacterium]|nr:hypothetical protein [Planctomycetaceae bacterium]